MTDFFFFQAEDGIRDVAVTGVQTCALPVSGLSGFFATRGIDIAEVSTRSYPAAHTGAPMFAVQMIVNVPSRIHVAHLREEFMEFCDTLNLDAILEPVKS